MIYCILFEDDEHYLEMRKLHMASHLEFLRNHADKIRSAGPLSDAADGRAAGGLWIVNAENADGVWGLIRSDPFWPTGLRKSVRVLAWHHVFSKVAW
jgi:uncharacterized protein